MTFLGMSKAVAPGASAVPLFCDRCRAQVQILMPADLDSLTTLAEAFERAHKSCPPRPESLFEEVQR
jgi:hypothetical protein